MSDRKSGPPLFELLADDKPTPKGLGGTNNPEMGTTKPRTKVELRPMEQEPDPSAASPARIPHGVTQEERSATLEDEALHTDHEKVVRLTMSRVYLVIAAVLLLLVLVWAGAYQIGRSAGKDEMESLIDDRPVVLPQRDPDPIAQNPDPIRYEPIESTPTDPPRSPARGVVGVLSPQGFLQSDPREPGMNYLQLGVLDAQQAGDAIEFMALHGETVIGVPLDSRGGSANNPVRYTLYSLGLAVPSEQYRSMESQRRSHVERIASLGDRWVRERRGGSDFSPSKTLWVKYE